MKIGKLHHGRAGRAVPVIALISYDAVLGCGYYESDPAHPSYPQGG